MRALCFDRFGPPEVLSMREGPDPAPAPGHAVVALRAIGLNFADIYRRQGCYHLAGGPPYVAGYEGAGVVEAAGEGSAFRPGDRVGFADVPFANAEKVLAADDRLVPLPDDVSFETAAALLLQGLTAHYLTRESHPLGPGQSAVVHAATGGVGLLLVQIAKLRGARVLGLASSEAKRQKALEAGADEAVAYDEGDWAARARAFAPGGADVVYDSVGATLSKSIEAARVGGNVVFFGMAGGDPPLIDPRLLMDTSKRLTGGDLWNVLRTADDRRSRAGELFAWWRDGRLRVNVAARFALEEGAAAHAYLESRRAAGKVLLIP